jgi:cyanophycin synthetase
MEMVADLPARRRIGVVAAPGDRRDEDIRAVAALCGGLDLAIVKEDDDRRGRRPGEIAELLVEGLRQAGLHGDQIESLPTEAAAVTRALEVIGDGDLLVILADDVAAVLAQIRPRASATGT